MQICVLQDMYGYSRKTVIVLFEGLEGALDVKDYIFHGHRHGLGRKIGIKKAKPSKKIDNGE